ncbi:MAG TPA: hypothetical protein VMQ58_01600 [Candidatus Saccharimonadales bacterium]|nr:hypothetical protein [Candidatus Saccharimonadales bacterium]
MTYLIYVGFILILIFGSVILFGAPYLPTLKNQIDSIFELLDLRKGQTIIELGSGDGRILLEAGKRGIKAIGYELNPILVMYSRIKVYKYRGTVKVIWGNYWVKDWPETDGIFVFLLDRYMQRLNKKVIQKYSKPINLVSFAFKIPDRKIDSSKKGLFLYKYNQ